MNKDQLLLEQAYQSIYESAPILVPRRSAEERQKNYNIAVQKQIKEYIKNGSKGDLDLRETPIAQLPADLHVGGHLNLYNTPITQLPAGLRVGGCLFLKYAPITQLPADLQVGGSLELSYTKITQLPADLQVGGDLHLRHTPIAKKYTKQQLKQMLPNVKGNIFK